MPTFITTIVLTAVIAGLCAGQNPSSAAGQSPQKRSPLGAGQSTDEEEATVVDPERISESSRIRGRLFWTGSKGEDLVTEDLPYGPVFTLRTRPMRTFEWEENLDDLSQYI